MDIYQKNLATLSRKDPNLFEMLCAIKPNEHFEIYINQSDLANFNIIKKTENDFIPLFNGTPIDETLEKLQKFQEFSNHPYLYCYGLGNGIFYKMLLQNRAIKRVVVIEPELEIIFIVLNLIDFSEEIQSDQLFLLDSNRANAPMINSLFQMEKKSKLYFKLYDLHIFNNFYEAYKNDILEKNKTFINVIEHNVISIGNDATDALTGLKNHVLNLPFMLKSPTLLELVNNIKNTNTAIIISTGPSLNKQLDLLKDVQDYATLFSIDASFPILHAAGIKPDLVFSLERVEASAKFYTKTPKEAQKGVIFALTSIVHEALRDSITDGISQFSMRPFGFTNAFNLHDYGYIGIGMSAANMAYEMAVHGRFDNVIFIGQDLAFAPNGASHAKNAVYGDFEIAKKDKKVFLEQYGGGGFVESNEIWQMFLKFFETDISQTPQINVINSTEGGARIKGTKEIPFREAIKLLSKNKKQPIKLRFPTKREYEKNIKSAFETCEDIIKYGLEKEAKITDVFLKVAKFCEDLEAGQSPDLEEINELNDKIDEIKLFFEETKFADYFIDMVQSYIFHQELDIAKILVRKTDSEEQYQDKKIDWIKAHKYWLFSLAGGVHFVIETTKESLERANALISKGN
ncbi:MAG: motility associated factor glycosyltransferase family protein [Helicobacter sp.]|nr:motility associated factor glycosyltransferase family protein [Helicobacter sp.]